MTLADLEQLSPGFNSYFKRWYSHQEELWEKEGNTAAPAMAESVLSVLCCALGPLERRDLLDIMTQVHGTRRVIEVDRLLSPLRRFLFGTGKRGAGYVLCHPRIGDYLRERYDADNVRRGFVAWGKAHISDLNFGRRKPQEASPYALQFLRAHFDESDAPPEDYMLLVEGGWLRAWQTFERGGLGFWEDVQGAGVAISRNHPHAPTLVQRLRCQLVLSSIASSHARLPAALIASCIRQSILSIREALSIVQHMEGRAFSGALRSLFPLLPDQLVDEGLALAASAQEHDRELAEIIALRISALSTKDRSIAIPSTLQAINRLASGRELIKTFVRLIELLPVSERALVQQAAIAQARKAEADEADNGRALAQLHDAAKKSDPRGILHHLFTDTVWHEKVRAVATLAVGIRDNPEAVREAWAAREVIADVTCHLEATAALLPLLPERGEFSTGF